MSSKKKLPKADAVNKKADLYEKVSSTWEFKSGRVFLRIAAALFFLSYLGLTLPFAWEWGWSRYYKSQPLSHLDTLIEKSINTADQGNLLSWVTLRPPQEREEILQKLMPQTAKLDSFFFLIFSHWAADQLDIQETVFWHFYARYRLRFDALRCGAPDSVINMDGLLALMPYGYIAVTVSRWPHLVPETIRRVLDQDAVYPADNNPLRVCQIIYRIEGDNFVPADRRHWARIRHDLRLRTELSLKNMEKAAQPAPEPP